MDSNELREMSMANAKMALEQVRVTYQARSNAIVTSTPKTNFRLTERQKEGIRKMMGYFGSLHNFGKKFEVHIGFLANGNIHLITLEGSAIVKHLKGVLEFEVYGDDGRDILNGIRSLWISLGSYG